MICAAKTQLDPANGPCIQRRSSAQVHKSAVQIVFVQAHLGIRIQGTSQTQNQISTAGLYQLATLGDTAGTAHDQMQALAAESAELKERSAKFHGGHRINVVNQRLGYLVRSGDPDALDSIVPMAFGNLALDLTLQGKSGRLVCVRHGVYDSVPVDVVTGRKKTVDVHHYYNAERLRPRYETFKRQPIFIMTSDVPRS